MKVILLKHVRGLGAAGEMKEVSDGYAANALLPRGLVKQATAKVLNDLKMNQKSEVIKQEKDKESTLEKLFFLNDKMVIFKERLNSKGNLYHALGAKEIIHAIYQQHNVNISNAFFKKIYSFRESGKNTIELSA